MSPSPELPVTGGTCRGGAVPRSPGTALLWVCGVCPLLLGGTAGTITCQMGQRSDAVEGRCPVRLTPELPRGPDASCAQCVSVHVWLKAEDFSMAPKIELVSQRKELIRPTLKKKRKGGRQVRCRSDVTQQPSHSDTWELVYDCIRAEPQTVVSASYTTTAANCSVSYNVPDPVPNFYVSVNRSSRSLNVTVARGGRAVYVRWCYRHGTSCMGGSRPPPRVTLDPARSPSALLLIPHLIPCVCVEVYYTCTDSRRHIRCPFYSDSSLTDVRDVWLSSDVTLFESRLTWRSQCPSADLKIFASLCWRLHKHLCAPIPNSTLEAEDDGAQRVYNTSAVDRHPQMCVQFSLQGSYNISCHFHADMSSWNASIEVDEHSACVRLSSSEPATFSAQLCVLSERGCVSTGQVHSVTVDGTRAEVRMSLAVHSLAERPCVQVWRSLPALHGRRILCPDYTHHRRGLYAVAAVVFTVVLALLGVFIHSLAKSGAADWLCIQKPILLVCSSEHHVSAVCALASVLQGELSATVHIALCAQSSQRWSGAGTRVADLGPLPWLYGRWEAVRHAQGRVLIVWSPAARLMYEKWRKERQMEGDRRTEVNPHGGEDLQGCVTSCDDRDRCPENNPSTVIEPVFRAALACLEGALQECKGQGVALVYFQGLGHSSDIPKALRAVPRYCLPQGFSGLIQELGGMRRRAAGALERRCRPRLLSKVLSVWVARQLARRLQTLLPHTQGKKTQRPRGTACPGATSKRKKHTPEQSGNVQEHEALNGST